MNDRPSGGERVVLVHVNFPAGKMEEDLEECKELSTSAGAEISAVITATRSAPESKYFVGTGKAEEIRQAVLATHADLVIFNHVLTPAQERNLERLANCRVIDRTGLILDIFSQRARSFEGKLQVELALLKHLSTRLVRGWTHLERQRGGIGLRGPGETQLESDRRLIRRKMKNISARLDKIRAQREQSRRARRKAIVPTVALVGYTNAGKSTLFNRLTGAEVLVANQLFATLDPTLRRIEYPDTGAVILADTVGFIRHLPHDLIDAFHATLEEVSQAELLLHVIDVSDEEKIAHIEEVNVVLDSIGASEVPRLLVYNKIDLGMVYPQREILADAEDSSAIIDRDREGNIKRVFISAYKGWGMRELLIAISEKLNKEILEHIIILPPHETKLRAHLYTREVIKSEEIDEEGNYHLRVRLPRVELEKIVTREKK